MRGAFVAHRMYTGRTRTILFAVSGAGVVPWRMVAEPCDISVAWRRPKAYLFRLTSLWLWASAEVGDLRLSLVLKGAALVILWETVAPFLQLKAAKNEEGEDIGASSIGWVCTAETNAIFTTCAHHAG